MQKKNKKRVVRNNFSENRNSKIKKVNWVLVLVMSVVFGWIGVDRFIMGKIWTGLLKLVTLGGLGVWWIVDIILIATKYQFKNIQWVD